MRTTLVGILIAAAASEVSRSDRLRSDVIASWNLLAHDLAFAEDQFLTFKGQRALAMMHLAMHDAVNAIVPIYETYAYPAGATRLAHPIAATSQAAHDVLIAQYPDQRTKIGDEHARWLALATDGSLRHRGSRSAGPSPRRSSRVAMGTAGISVAHTSSEAVPATIRRLRPGMASSPNPDFASPYHSSSSTRPSSDHLRRHRCGRRRTRAHSVR
jgi:hypothetical protein